MNTHTNTSHTNTYIIGYRAAGKSSVARLLSKKLGKELVSIDDEIIKKHGRIDAFVKNNGWDAFRKIESRILEKVSRRNNLVVDCGGGIVEKQENIALMRKTGTVIWLKASAKSIVERLKDGNRHNLSRRPSLTGKPVLEEVSDVLSRRRALYKRAAHHAIDTDGKSIQDVAEEVVKKLKVKKTRKHTLLKTPRIALSIGKKTLKETLKELEKAQKARLAEFIEIRLDRIKGLPQRALQQCLEQFIRRSEKPVIVTNRAKREGGFFEGSEKERLALLRKAVELGADYVDVELFVGKKRINELISLRNKLDSKTGLICSYHNFKGLPKNLDKVYERLKGTNADIIKIACTGNSYDDNLRMFELLSRARKEGVKIIAIVMGDYGKPSRVLSGLFGAFITTYAPLDKRHCAQGQLSYDEAIDLYTRMV